MNVQRCLLVISVFVSFSLGTAILVSAQEGQLKVLRNYEGRWDCEFTIHSQSEREEAKQCSGDVEGRFILGNNFMQQTGRYQLGDNASPFVIRTIMSVDHENDRFQFDYYNSSGEINRSFGRWDPRLRTMTSTMEDDDDGNVTTIVADFSTKDTERWTIETKNRKGKTTLRITGTNKRKPKDR